MGVPARPATLLGVISLAITGALFIGEAHAQGRMCERDSTGDLCWRCADVAFDYNRLCPTDPCAEADLCVRDAADTTTIVCLPSTTVCCTDTCATAPGCAGTGATSSCSGTTCAFYGTCPPLPVSDAAVPLLDAGPVRPDASVSDAGAAEDSGVDPERDAGPPPDAGSRPMDAGNGGMDAGPPPTPGLEPRFGGGGGCVCRAAPSRSGRSTAGLLLGLGLVAILVRRRR